MFGSMFALHTEESDLFSMNYMHEGSSKFWYIVPPSHADRLEQCLREVDPLDISHCQAPIRHKKLFPNPIELIQSHNIPVYRIEQCPNEIVITFPRAYHWGFNGGLNMAESINFALPSWVLFGQKTRSCTCHRQGDRVKIDMTPFSEDNVHKYTQTHLKSLCAQSYRVLLESPDKQPMFDLGQLSSPVAAAATPLVDLSLEEVETILSADLPIFSSAPLPQIAPGLSCTADNEQALPSVSTSSIITAEELSFECCSSQESDSTIIEKGEIAAETAYIRRRWTVEKGVRMSRLIADLTKPEIGSIHQWEKLINGDNVNLDDYLPENMQNSIHHAKKSIKSFADWTVAFTSYRKAILYLFKHRGPELDAHFEHISKICRESDAIQCILAYEADVRHHVTEMPNLTLFSDFSFLISKHFTMVQPTSIVITTHEICLNYNSYFARCKLKMCPRLHVCSICFGLMGAHKKHSAAYCLTPWRNHRRKYLSQLAYSSYRLPISSGRCKPSYYPY